jgi:hypothetical protein
MLINIRQRPVDAPRVFRRRTGPGVCNVHSHTIPEIDDIALSRPFPILRGLWWRC